MKTKELMIGDWVESQLVDGTEYVKVNALNTLNIDVENIDVENMDNLCYVQYIELVNPIPLTEKILGKNGIRYQEGNPWYQLGTEVHMCSNDESMVVEGMFIYVHELQHALRLCGLSELADNFKVK